MPVIVVTRLRLRDPALLTGFFTAGAAALEQANKADGNLAADALRHADNVFWTCTAWQGRDRVLAFINSAPHLTTMGYPDDWCDEATFTPGAARALDVNYLPGKGFGTGDRPIEPTGANRLAQPDRGCPANQGWALSGPSR
jgi:hypothetical protein